MTLTNLLILLAILVIPVITVVLHSALERLRVLRESKRMVNSLEGLLREYNERDDVEIVILDDKPKSPTGTH